jgi:hypothetical protein
MAIFVKDSTGAELVFESANGYEADRHMVEVFTTTPKGARRGVAVVPNYISVRMGADSIEAESFANKGNNQSNITINTPAISLSLVDKAFIALVIAVSSLVSASLVSKLAQMGVL